MRMSLPAAAVMASMLLAGMMASAAGPGPEGDRLSLELAAPPQGEAGAKIDLIAHLAYANGTGVERALVTFYKVTWHGNLTLGDVLTDQAGVAVLHNVTLIGPAVRLGVTHWPGGNETLDASVVIDVIPKQPPAFVYLTNQKFAVWSLVLILGTVWGCYVFVMRQLLSLPGAASRRHPVLPQRKAAPPGWTGPKGGAGTGRPTAGRKEERP